jgi:hypothetical protein
MKAKNKRVIQNPTCRMKDQHNVSLALIPDYADCFVDFWAM